MKEKLFTVVLFVALFLAAFVTYKNVLYTPHPKPQKPKETWQVVNVTYENGEFSQYIGNMTVKHVSAGWELVSEENTVFISNNHLVTVDNTKKYNNLEESFIKAYHSQDYYNEVDNLQENEY